MTKNDFIDLLWKTFGDVDVDFVELLETGDTVCAYVEFRDIKLEEDQNNA